MGRIEETVLDYAAERIANVSTMSVGEVKNRFGKYQSKDIHPDRRVELFAQEMSSKIGMGQKRIEELFRLNPKEAQKRLEELRASRTIDVEAPSSESDDDIPEADGSVNADVTVDSGTDRIR